MSNIQITENGSGKYSPEWFFSESQTPEWISFAHKADELRENFMNLFGIERLKSLSGKNLLTSLFYNDEGNKTNLCYSLAMLDYALRRRFSFFTMKPGFNTPGFQAYQDYLKSDAFNKLIACVKQLNSKIAEDISLGEGFSIGHSYFCGLTPETANTQTLSSIVEYELIPLLKEYWFDESAKIVDWSDRLRSAVK